VGVLLNRWVKKITRHFTQQIREHPHDFQRKYFKELFLMQNSGTIKALFPRRVRKSTLRQKFLKLCLDKVLVQEYIILPHLSYNSSRQLKQIFDRFVGQTLGNYMRIIAPNLNASPCQFHVRDWEFLENDNIPGVLTYTLNSLIQLRSLRKSRGPFKDGLEYPPTKLAIFCNN